MPHTRESTAYAQRLILEYNRTRKLLRKYFKKRHDPDEAQAKIKEILENTTRRQSKIIGYTLNDAFKVGAKEGSREIGNATISAAAPVASMGFNMTKVADTHLNKITSKTIGSVGKYNSVLTNQLQLEYNTLLADNRLVTSLNKDGWTPWLGKSLEARGVDPKVIALAKGQTTTKKIISILEHEGIRGGKNPREVSKLLLPHIQRHFGPDGVVINNVGKFKRILKVDVNGNYKYVKQAIIKPYRATPKAYSNLLARSSMIQAHHEGRYQSLQKTGLVDYYISKSVLDANTCNLCATMHGQRVSHSEGPLYHPSGACELKPIWKKDSGLKNKDPAFYENQRDQHFWKQHQLAEYNKGMPRGAKLKFHSMLPKDALTAMPDKAAMRAIRYNTLGKPTAIKPMGRTPKVPISKPEVKTLTTMNDKEVADELWKKTIKDSKEHSVLLNGKPRFYVGNGDAITIKRFPKTPFELHHTHPSWDAPLSGGDLSVFITHTNMKRMTASSKQHIYSVTRMPETATYVPNLGLVFNMKMKEIFKKSCELHKISVPSNTKLCNELWRDAALEAHKIMAKIAKYKFEVIKR